MAVWLEGRRCNRMPSKDRDRSCLGLYDRRSNVCQWMLYTILILAQNTMIEVMNHIEVQLKSTGRSEHFCSCVTTMMTIPPGEIMCLVHIAD